LREIYSEDPVVLTAQDLTVRNVLATGLPFPSAPSPAWGDFRALQIPARVKEQTE